MARSKKSLGMALGLFLALAAVISLNAASAQAASYQKIERRNMVIIGDRVVDIAYHLGVLPAGMSTRCSLWPLCDKVKVVSQPLGCPGCLSRGDDDKLIKFVKKHGVKLALVEKSSPFCFLEPEANPMDAVTILQKLGVEVKVVDFGQGVPSAISQTAAFLDRTEAGKALREKYEKAVAKTKKKIAGQKLNKRVVVLFGVYQAQSGNTFLQVEAPGGYTDKYFLEPLGCTNVGQAMAPKGKKPGKGRWTVRRLKGLPRAKPEVIVITGDSAAVQKALIPVMEANPELRSVPVISLPVYIGSSVIEQPEILAKWYWGLK